MDPKTQAIMRLQCKFKSKISVMKTPGFFPAILGKGPWPKLEKMIDLTSKLGEINGIEHNKGRNTSSKSSYFRLYYAKHTT